MTPNVLLTTALALTMATSASGATLLANGDFEAGNTGFTSDLTFAPGGSTGAAQYTIGTDPNAWFGLFASFGDNTSGSGNMMIVNGSTTAGNVVWSETVSVDANSGYTFDGWIADIFSGQSAVSLAINGTVLGQITAPSTAGVWDAFGFNWSSGTATSATLELLQQTTAFGGNDYALDDLSFSRDQALPPVPLPAAGWLLIAGLAGLAGLGRRRRA